MRWLVSRGCLLGARSLVRNQVCCSQSACSPPKTLAQAGHCPWEALWPSGILVRWRHYVSNAPRRDPAGIPPPRRGVQLGSPLCCIGKMTEHQQDGHVLQPCALHKEVLSQVLTNCYGTAGGREAAASAGWAQPGRLLRSGQARVPQVSIQRCADRCNRPPACSRFAGLIKFVTPFETLQVLTLPTMLTLARVAAIPVMFAGDDSPMPMHFAALQGLQGL